MADGTRLKALDDHVRALEQQFQELAVGHELRFEGISGRIEAIRTEGQAHYDALYRESANTSKKLEKIMDLLMNSPQPLSMQGASSSGLTEEKGLLPTPPNQIAREDISAQGLQGRHNSYLPFPRLNFPIFTGEQPRNWVRRCERYFDIYGIKEQQKLEIIALHLEAKADTWFQGYIAERESVNWRDFTEEACKRFDNKDLNDVVEEFNKLTQHGSAEEYQEQFEDLRARLLTTKSHFTQEYFLSSFLSGIFGY